MPPRYYGWRPSLPDRRDKLYSAPRSVLAALPPAVDLTAGMGPVLDQGQLGSCGPNSVDSLILFDQGAENIPVSSISRLFVYYNTRALMGTVASDSGVDNRTMLKALAKWGFCDEAAWPYDVQQFRQQAPQSVYDAADANRITDYASVPQSAQTMKGCLAGGKPFLFGFTVYESFESSEVERTGLVPMPSAGERVLGGHDVCVVGYDDATGLWKFKNSWGTSWGRGGYGYFPAEYVLSSDLSSDFWVINTIPGAKPKPTPVPSSVTTFVLSSPLSAGTYTVTPAA